MYHQLPVPSAWAPRDCGNPEIDNLIADYLCTSFIQEQLRSETPSVTLDQIVSGLLGRELTNVERRFFRGVGYSTRSAIMSTNASFFAALRAWGSRRAEADAERGKPVPRSDPEDAFAYGGRP